MTTRFWLTWTGIGALLGIGFIISPLWWMMLLGIALTAWQYTKITSNSTFAVGMWFAWLVKYLLALVWFWSTYPIEWLPLQSGLWQILLIFWYWSTAALWLSSGVFFLVCGLWLIGRYVPQLTQKHRLLLMPFLWVWAEVLGSFFFSLFTVGPGGSFNTKFSFGYSGYLLTEHSVLLQLAAWGGVYMLTVIMVGLGVGMYHTWQQPRGRWFVFILLLIFIGTADRGEIKPAVAVSGEYTVAIVDTFFGPQILQSDAADRSAALEAAVSAALAHNPDYVVLPEDARYLPADRFAQKAAKKTIEATVGAHPVVLIDSSQTWRDSDSVLQATIYNGHTKEIEVVDKRYLVPQGEYTPSLYKAILQLLGQRDIVSYIEQSRGYVVGTGVNQSVLSAPVPGILFCFESVDPRGVRSILQERHVTPFITHIVSHAWFHEPTILWRQLDSMLLVQAVWNNTYIVSAGNQVVGAVYTPTGHIERQQPVVTGEGWQVRIVTIPHVSVE